MIFVPFQNDSKYYNVFVHEQYGNECVIIMGKNDIGNDYIISHAKQILTKLFGIEKINEHLIWIHGYGPSAHSILYKKSKAQKLLSLDLELFIKSKLSDKSEKDKPLTCSLLKDVKKTETLGLVNVVHQKLSKLLG